MLIVGCDYHPSFQQIAWVETDSGEVGERALLHSTGEAEKFYRKLKDEGVKVRVGIEATGHSRWFERLLADLGFELWIGNAAEIRAKRVRKQKNDREDARLLRTLMIENRFPRVWLPDVSNRDLRQLLWHRHRLVQMRTQVKNQLQAVALNEGVRRKKGLWSEAGRAQLESFQLMPWATWRRKDLLELLDNLTPRIAALTAEVENQAEHHREAQRLMTHPGVGPLTALAYVLIIGSPDRFRCGKQIGSYLGLIPCEESSARRQRLGHISKQGNALLRFLLIEAAQAATRSNPTWRREFVHLTMRRGRQIAVVALARKLAVRLYWMWRNGWDYEKSLEFGSHVGQPGTGYGVK
jgi:transposase